LLLAPLYALLWALLLRSGLLDLSGRPLTGEQYKTLFAFLGVALGVLATVVAALVNIAAGDRALLQKEESERRTLAQKEESERRALLQRDESERRILLETQAANDRQRLDTAIAVLNLIKQENGYAGKAVSGAAIATLVVLGYPVIAMRTLHAAMTEGVVDIASAVWVIDQVLNPTARPPLPELVTDDASTRRHEIEASREDAAQLLFDHVADLTRGIEPGACHWPTCALGAWPAGLTVQCGWLLMCALVRMLLSRPASWWSTEGSTWSWVVYTLRGVALDEAEDSRLRQETAAYAIALLDVGPGGKVLGPRGEELPATTVAGELAAVTGRAPSSAGLSRQLEEWVQDARA
jgi:hypothetical protein